VLDPELHARLATVANDLFPSANVLAAYAYGSRVSGRPRPTSDLDVGYYLDGYRRNEMLPIRDEMLMADRLSDALGVSVDLRNLADAPLELRGRVLEEGVRIYSGNAAARVALERELLGHYHDYKDIFRQMHELRLRAIAERGL
jgi:predicted nucleotidyltransferase